MAKNPEHLPQIHHNNVREWLFWHIGAFAEHGFALRGQFALTDAEIRNKDGLSGITPDDIRQTGRKAIAAIVLSATVLTGGLAFAATDAAPNSCSPEAVGTADQCS